MIKDNSSNESTNRALIFSMILSLAAKVLNFGQSIVVSYAFGTNQSTDILFYSLSVVVLLTTFQGAINHQVIIPTAIDLRKNVSEDNSKGFISYVYFIYAVIGLIVGALLFISPMGVIAFLSRFSEAAISSNINIIRLILPAFLLIILNTYMLDIFTSYKYFTFPMLLDMLKNLIIMAFVLGFKDVFKVESLAIGVLAGNLAQFIVLSLLMLVKIKLKLSFKRYRISSSVKKNILYVVTGRASTLLNDFIMIYLLSGFSAGVFSAMDYAYRIDNVLNMVIVGQITTVVGIRIMELHAVKKFEELSSLFLKYLSIGLFFIFPICFIVSFNAYPIISLLFERGSFGKEAVAITAMFLKYFALTVPLELINGFIVILIIAKQIQKVAFRWQIFQNILNILVAFIVVSNFGYSGYPIGIVASFGLYIFLLSYFLMKSEFKYIGHVLFLKTCFMNVLLNVFVIGIVYLVFRNFTLTEGYLGKMLYIIYTAALYISVFLTVSYFTGLHRENIKGIYKGLKGVVLR